MLNCYYPEKWEALMTSIRNEGKDEWLRLGKNEGKTEGRADATTMFLNNLMNKHAMNFDTAADFLGVPEGERASLRAHFA